MSFSPLTPALPPLRGEGEKVGKVPSRLMGEGEETWKVLPPLEDGEDRDKVFSHFMFDGFPLSGYEHGTFAGPQAQREVFRTC